MTVVLRVEKGGQTGVTRKAFSMERVLFVQTKTNFYSGAFIC